MSTKTRCVEKCVFRIADFWFFLEKAEKPLYCKEKLPVEKPVENVDNEM